MEYHRFIFLFIILILITLCKLKFLKEPYDNTKDNYDIIYSYTCHEEPEGLLDTLDNLFYFNKSNKIFVILHCNDFMYENLPPLLEKNKNKDNIKINNIHYNKELYNYSIFQSHIDNFEYCFKNNITSKYFIILASNCIFKKEITINDIDELYKILPTFDFPDKENQRYTSHVNWHWGSTVDLIYD
jgi:hypothetical protein